MKFSLLFLLPYQNDPKKKQREVGLACLVTWFILIDLSCYFCIFVRMSYPLLYFFEKKRSKAMGRQPSSQASFIQKVFDSIALLQTLSLTFFFAKHCIIIGFKPK